MANRAKRHRSDKAEQKAANRGGPRYITIPEEFTQPDGSSIRLIDPDSKRQEEWREHIADLLEDAQEAGTPTDALQKVAELSRETRPMVEQAGFIETLSWFVKSWPFERDDKGNLKNPATFDDNMKRAEILHACRAPENGYLLISAEEFKWLEDEIQGEGPTAFNGATDVELYNVIHAAVDSQPKVEAA